MDRVAFFVDWDNFRSTLQMLQKNDPALRKFNFNNPYHLSTLFKSFLNVDECFYRIYFYTAKMIPFEELNKLIPIKQQSTFEKWWKKDNNRAKYLRKYEISTKFLDAIVQMEYVALRLGKLRFNGLKTGGYPDLVQKEVDMLLGLDISHIAYLKLATKVILFSKDTDIVPAMKVARINGLEVILPHIIEDKNPYAVQLIKHSDCIRKVSLKEVIKKLIMQNMV